MASRDGGGLKAKAEALAERIDQLDESTRQNHREAKKTLKALKRKITELTEEVESLKQQRLEIEEPLRMALQRAEAFDHEHNPAVAGWTAAAVDRMKRKLDKGQRPVLSIGAALHDLVGQLYHNNIDEKGQDRFLHVVLDLCYSVMCLAIETQKTTTTK